MEFTACSNAVTAAVEPLNEHCLSTAFELHARTVNCGIDSGPEKALRATESVKRLVSSQLCKYQEKNVGSTAANRCEVQIVKPPQTFLLNKWRFNIKMLGEKKKRKL